MNRLADTRKARGLTGGKLAVAAALSDSAVSAYELGQRRPSLAVVRRLAAALGVAPGDLFDAARACQSSNTTVSLTPGGDVQSQRAVKIDPPSRPPKPVPRLRWPVPLPDLPEAPRTGWWADAACVGMDVELFYPPAGNTRPDEAVIAACTACPVRGDCLVDALFGAECSDFGVQGGLPEGRRRELRRRISRRRTRSLGGAA